MADELKTVTRSFLALTLQGVMRGIREAIDRAKSDALARSDAQSARIDALEARIRTLEGRSNGS